MDVFGAVRNVSAVKVVYGMPRWIVIWIAMESHVIDRIVMERYGSCGKVLSGTFSSAKVLLGTVGQLRHGVVALARAV